MTEIGKNHPYVILARLAAERYLSGGVMVTPAKPESGAGFVGSAWKAAALGDATVPVAINFGSTPVPDVE